MGTKKSGGSSVAGGLAAVGVVLALLVWWAWERSPERRAERIDEAIAAIEQGLRSDRADLMRERAECEAGAVEFGQDYAQACAEQLQIQARQFSASKRAMEERIQALRSERAALPVANGQPTH